MHVLNCIDYLSHDRRYVALVTPQFCKQLSSLQKFHQQKNMVLVVKVSI